MRVQFVYINNTNWCKNECFLTICKLTQLVFPMIINNRNIVQEKVKQEQNQVNGVIKVKERENSLSFFDIKTSKSQENSQTHQGDEGIENFQNDNLIFFKIFRKGQNVGNVNEIENRKKHVGHHHGKQKQLRLYLVEKKQF